MDPRDDEKRADGGTAVFRRDLIAPVRNPKRLGLLGLFPSLSSCWKLLAFESP